MRRSGPAVRYIVPTALAAVFASACGGLGSADRETLTGLRRQVDELARHRAEDARRLDDAVRRLAVLESLPAESRRQAASAAVDVPPPPPALPVVRLEPPSSGTAVGVTETAPARIAPATVGADDRADAAWETPDDALVSRPYQGPGFGNDPGQGYIDLGRSGPPTVRLVGRPAPSPVPSAPTVPQGGTPSSAFGPVPRLPVAVSAEPAIPPPVPETSAYDRAMDAYRGRRWSEAIALFDAVAAHGLSEPHLGQAVFLRAEAAFQSGGHLDAIGQFERFLARYPGSPRAAEATNRMAMASERIGDTERAIDLYRQVVGRHAGTRAAATAAERLAGLGELP